MSEEVKKSLVEKLAEACDAVGGVEKKGRNQAQGYDYVKAADVAKAIRHELFKRGIVLIPDELECTTKQVQFQNAKGEQRHSNEVVVKTAYVITDGVETLTMHGFGIAWDAGDKAVYKAKTGALKYFLRGLGLIPDEKDDPEYEGNTITHETDEEFDQRTRAQRLVSQAQINAWTSAEKQGVRTKAQIEAKFKQHGIECIEDMPKEKFNVALKWLLNPDKELVKPMETSVKQLNFSKLFALAGEKGVPEADVKRYAYEQFDIDSMTKMTPLQFDETLAWVKTLA